MRKKMIKKIKAVTSSKYFKAFIVFLIYLAQNAIVGGLDEVTIGVAWYSIVMALEAMLLITSWALRELNVELSFILGLGLVTNYIVWQDYLEGTNVLYDWYPMIMTNLYYAALAAFAIYFIKPVIKSAYKKYKGE